MSTTKPLPGFEPPAIQRAVPGRLRALFRARPEPLLLLGAGASVSSGIPAAEEAAERIARWRWCLDHDRSVKDPGVRRADYLPWLRTQPWYDPDASLADLYPQAVRYLLNVASDRRAFFEDLINPQVPPGRGYRALVNMMYLGWVSTVLSTNFDECIQKARDLETHPHHLISIKTRSDLVRLSSAPPDPQLVYVHGSVEHLTDKNTDVDVQNLDPELAERLRPLLRDHPIIVVGYRGAERSVMNGLFMNNLVYTNNFAHGIYWCVLERDIDLPLPGMVADLAAAVGGNFSKVAIQGFDSLFETELYGQLLADGLPPARRDRSQVNAETPADMLPAPSTGLAGLDLVLLFTRLVTYSNVLRTWVPGSYDAEWTVRTATTFNLLLATDGPPFPSLAGWLLFAHDPTPQIPQAAVRFKAEGPAQWLRQCFGSEVEIATAPDEAGSLEAEIRGNLWAQLDRLTDLLSSVNRQFRLKQEVSRQVRSYSPLALKEMIVNALVHRNYGSPDPIEIHVTPEQVTTRSPGGLVDAAAAQTFGQELQALIKGGQRKIKGYRNPVIADLFYGGGQMDHTGSGLSDMWKETVNNNGDADFGPDAENAFFHVTIRARPEAVDEITNTALADDSQTARFMTNILPVHTMPCCIWHAGTDVTYTGGLFREAGGKVIPPGHIDDRRFYSLYNLEEVTERNDTPFHVGDVETLEPSELTAFPNGENILAKLLTDAVLGHCRALGMQIDYKRKRAHFPRDEDGDEHRITYKARFKRATRTVAKARMKRGTGEVSYYEHKALSVSVVRYGPEWCLVLTPGYAFTRNGFGKLIGNQLINSLSTRRAAKDFNPTLQNDLSFWLAMLSGETEGIFALRPDPRVGLEDWAPTIIVSSGFPSASFNSGAYDELFQSDAEHDFELDDLDTELAAMVEGIVEAATPGQADADD